MPMDGSSATSMPVQDLQEREQAFRVLTEQVPAIIYRAAINELSQTTYISPRIAELGYTPEEWLADPAIWTHSLHPDDRERVQRQLLEFHLRGGELALEYRLRRRDGSWRHYQDKGQIVRDLDGQPLYLQGLMIDVSEQKALEATLSFLTQRALLLLELPRLTGTLDEASFMQRGLEMAEQLTDSTISFIHLVSDDEEAIELVTWSRSTLYSYCQAVFNRHYPASEAGIWAEALRQRQPVVFNDYATAPGKRGLPEGHATLARLISLPVVENNKVVMLAGIGNKATDYTQRDVETLQLIANDIWHFVQRSRNQKELAANLQHQRELNAKLEAAQSQLLQSEKMASIGQLAAGVAHELNNPIGFVNSNLGTLEKYLHDIFEIADACEESACRASNPADFAAIQSLKQSKDIDFIRQDVFQLMAESQDGLQRVKKIVQDLKDFSRPGETNWQWADVHAGLDSTLNIVWNELKYKCTVKKDYGDLPQIRCLLSQLNQVFMNLLVNAAHAIETKGEITIATRRLGEDAVQIGISDTGKGIAPEHQNRIFEPFFTTKPVGKGTGLGLSIAWGIINKHHGRIEVASEVGKGTTFTVTLPIDPPADDSAAVLPAPTFEE